MEVRTSSNTAQMSTIFIWIGVANVVGVLVIGPLFDHINNMLLLSVCFLVMAIAGALAPTWTSLTTFHALAAVATALYSSLVAGELYRSLVVYHVIQNLDHTYNLDYHLHS